MKDLRNPGLTYIAIFPTSISVENQTVKNCPSKITRTGVSNPAPGEILSCRFQLQPQLNTPRPGNQGVQGYLIITDRCVGAELELKYAGQ